MSTVPLAVAVVLAVAGCGSSAGGLSGNWATFPEAKPVVPVVGDCYNAPYSLYWDGAAPVRCQMDRHRLETAFVGAFTGADAERSGPPLAGTPAAAAAYAQCQAAANEYLGGDWHTAMVWLGLIMPTARSWSGGARWFRCDLMHFAGPNPDEEVETGRVKDGLRDGAPLAIRCIDTTENSSGHVTPTRSADCAQPHNGEFAGLYTAPDIPYPTDAAQSSKLGDQGCEAVVAKFLGFGGGHVDNPVVGWMWTGFTERSWKLGDRTTQCYAIAYTPSRKMTGSVRGIGSRRPPG